MDLVTFLKLYGIAVPTFFVIDMLWLGLIARGLYRDKLGYLLAESVNWPAAIIFYLLFLVGLVVFVVYPAYTDSSLSKAVLLGGLFGLITYATYDLTNLATIRDWPLSITVIDLAWGAVLAASVSVVTYLIAQKMG